MKQFKFLAAIPIIMAFVFTACNNADEKKAEPTAAAPDTTAAKPKETAPAPATLFNVAVIIHKVANYTKWLPLYESDDSARMANGLSNYVLGRGMDKDSNTVLVALKMADPVKAKAMASSPALKEKMKQGGVIGAPIVFFEENVMMDTSTMANTIARVMVTHKVKDWDAWKKEFDSHKQVRLDAGLVDRVVGHSIDDNHMVRIVFAITDMAKAKAFMASKDLKDKMAAAGVEGPPTFFYYTIAKKY
ncbi:hypothetical protein [Ferruginibacter profundus]